MAIGIDVNTSPTILSGTENPDGTRAANFASPMRTRAKRTRPRSSMRSIVADSRPDAGAATLTNSGRTPISILAPDGSTP
jgi:hypothetical protein